MQLLSVFRQRDRAKFVGMKDRQGAKFAGRLRFIRQEARDGQTTDMCQKDLGP